MPRYQIWILKYIVPYLGVVYSLFVAPSKVKVKYKELKNKIYIMELVNDADRILGLSKNESLEEAISKVQENQEFEKLWLYEGASFRFHLNKIYQSNGHLDQITKDLPMPSMAMVHAGFGLALCRYYLEQYKKGFMTLAQSIDKIYQIVEGKTLIRYKTFSFESLGLVTLMLHGPKMVTKLDTLLQKKYPEIVPLFWHGVGRASYFYPTNFLPTNKALHRPIRILNKLPKNKISKQNMTAGILAAFILVNMKSPTVYEELFQNTGFIEEWEWIVVDRMEKVPQLRILSSDSKKLLNDLITHNPVSKIQKNNWIKYVKYPIKNDLKLSSSQIEPEKLYFFKAKDK